MTQSPQPVLEVEDLSIRFQERGRSLLAVRNLSFQVARGETLAIVGESGCGKSITALALLGLVPPPGRAEGKAIRLEGRNLLGLGPEALRDVRGRRIAMVFQEPMTTLNPVLTIGEQIVETIRDHETVSRREARDRALTLLERVHIPDPVRRFGEHPHRLSGGMRQRVVIAMALACNPVVLVADEPTTALDVTIQAQILDLIDELKQGGMGVVLITHDLGVVAGHAERVLVMYAGRKVEERAAADLFATPLHPYTRGLIAARPRRRVDGGGRPRLVEIPGTVPSLAAMPPGCAFAPRCASATEDCTAAEPPLTVLKNTSLEDGQVACLRVGDFLAPSHSLPHARLA
ncbi:ATP-binding cassette domain-containing protein [Azospirillum melinis]|uniref:ATP-binding cassette domain-containing protein n=1 Tax=Azospirillum melinis TaxID=328839 RepID=A0ABX2KCW3_9PROT|nr:ABC transporter ATP-binding protein [Azospirillum melinis]MBP2305910.1 peptide/nickel transport system ATP-binding protein [Azospirillum melinis]NUA99200.1 ATP-binding cassette domain-containing protein [Azospirillum melinis]